jgi:hypothetical protein
MAAPSATFGKLAVRLEALVVGTDPWFLQTAPTVFSSGHLCIAGSMLLEDGLCS